MDDLVDRYHTWLLKKTGVTFKRDRAGRMRMIWPPGSPLKEPTVRTYISIVRSYLRWAKNPLSKQDAHKYIMQHPNSAVVSALRYFFEMHGQQLDIPKGIRRKVSEIMRNGMPQSERRHDVIDWQDWTKIIDAFPMNGVPKEEVQQGAVFGIKLLTNPRLWRYIKAIAIIQLLWGMRAGDAIHTEKIQVERSHGDTILRISVVKKGDVSPTERTPIYRSILERGNKRWMLKYFDWLVDWAREYKQATGDYPVRPFLNIKGRTRTLVEKTVKLMYYAAIRYTAEKVLGKRLSTHDIRRSAITTLLNKENVPVQKVARWVQHRKVDTTMRYYRADVAPEDIYG